MDDGAGLTDREVLLYRAFVAQPGASLFDVSAQLGTSVHELDKPASTLVELGLASCADGEHYVAISPLLAEVTELGAEELELSARRAAVEARRKAIRAVLPDWVEVLREHPTANAVDIVTGPNDVGNVMMHYAARCREELLSVAPGRGPSRLDPRIRMANLYSLGRGVRTRALYQHIALRDRVGRAYLHDLAEHGAHIRVAPSVPGRSLVIDREAALLPIPASDPALLGGLAVIHEPNVIAWVVATFEQLWAEATPLAQLLGQRQNDAEVDHTRAAILRLMAEGEKDDAISRRLSISVRTCRRHIADYMAQVGATSRFQAGVVAARNGHLDVPTGG
jgi:DNA-binding CsgD family transcriptional regulator